MMMMAIYERMEWGMGCWTTIERKKSELQKEDECAEHNTNWLSGHRSNHTKSDSCCTAAKCYYPFPALGKRRQKVGVRV